MKVLITERQLRKLISRINENTDYGFVNVEEFESNVVPIGPEPSDGAVYLYWSDNFDISVSIEGKNVNSIIDGDGKDVTRVTIGKNTYAIFLKNNPKKEVELVILVTDKQTKKQQEVRLKVIIDSPKKLISYKLQPKGNKQYSLKQYQVPSNIQYPPNLTEKIKGGILTNNALIIIESPVGFNVESNIFDIKENENLFRLDKFTYILSNSKTVNFELNLNPQIITIPFNQMMDPDTLPSLVFGQSYYFRIE